MLLGPDRSASDHASLEFGTHVIGGLDWFADLYVSTGRGGLVRPGFLRCSRVWIDESYDNGNHTGKADDSSLYRTDEGLGSSRVWFALRFLETPECRRRDQRSGTIPGETGVAVFLIVPCPR